MLFFYLLIFTFYFSESPIQLFPIPLISLISNSLCLQMPHLSITSSLSSPLPLFLCLPFSTFFLFNLTLNFPKLCLNLAKPIYALPLSSFFPNHKYCSSIYTSHICIPCPFSVMVSSTHSLRLCSDSRSQPPAIAPRLHG
ncbi:unnamed protein product [Prunus armeniaca]